MKHWENLLLVNLSEEVDGILYLEEWRPIVGYEGLYEVSSFGRIKSIDRNFISKTNKNYNRKGTIRKQFDDYKRGYLKLLLYKNNKSKSWSVHRLVAIAFLPNPKNLREVNHIRGDKKDNRLWKLEWVSSSENQKHAYRSGKVKMLKGKFGKNHHSSKPVYQYSMDGVFIKRWDSAADIERANIAFSAGVVACCRGKIKSSKGFIWKN